jgi:hypothetical protein
MLITVFQEDKYYFFISADIFNKIYFFINIYSYSSRKYIINATVKYTQRIAGVFTSLASLQWPLDPL